MKVYSIDKLSNLSETINNVLSSTIPTIGILENDIQCVFHKDDDERINFSLCSELNIPLITISSTKGAVISNIGDLASMIWLPNVSVSTWGKFVFSKLQEHLIKYKLPVTLKNNDILLYNRKIGGYSEEITPTGVIGVLFIAMEDAQDLVNLICLKHSDKQTAGLHNFGITTTEIKDKLIEASKEYVIFAKLEGGN